MLPVHREPPHPPCKTLSQALRRLQDTKPRLLRQLRPAELEALIERMLDIDPTRRPALPLTVMSALTPFADHVG